MGASKHETEARRLLEERGATFVRQTRHCELWQFPWGRRVGLPGTSPSDLGRVWPNALAEVKRAIKEHDQEDGVNGDVTDAELVGRKVDLNLLGVYVRKKRTVTVIERQEAVVPIEAIAKLLGLPVPEEGPEVVLLDVKGKVIEGPVTVAVERETETEDDGLAVPQAGEG